MVPNWDQEIESILSSVESAITEVEALAKSEPGKTPAAAGTVKKNEPMQPPKANGGPMKKDGAPESDENKPPHDEAAEAGAPPAPAPDAGGAPGEGAPSDAPAPEAGAPGEGAPQAGAPGEEQLGQESADAPISDEELKEIYGSMAPEELQRHFMAIREILRGAQQPSPEAGAQPPAAPPAPAGAPMAMSEKENGMNKTEQAEFEALKKKNQELEASLGRLATVMEVALRPERKAVTDIAYIQKSENDKPEGKELSKAEVRALANEKCKDKSLSKNDRDAISDFLLRGEQSEKVMQIIKGGK